MKYLLSCFIIGVFISACSEKEADPPAPNKTELITASAWKYDNAGMDADRNGTIDVSISSQLQPCQTDNTITFSGNGTGVVSEGSTKCDPNAPQNTPVTWSFANNEGSINIGGGGIIGISGQFKIITLNTTTLTLSKDTTITGFGSLALVVQLKH